MLMKPKVRMARILGQSISQIPTRIGSPCRRKMLLFCHSSLNHTIFQPMSVLRLPFPFPRLPFLVPTEWHHSDTLPFYVFYELSKNSDSNWQALPLDLTYEKGSAAWASLLSSSLNDWMIWGTGIRKTDWSMLRRARTKQWEKKNFMK